MGSVGTARLSVKYRPRRDEVTRTAGRWCPSFQGRFEATMAHGSGSDARASELADSKRSRAKQ
jgi:hypothetical protein